MTIRRNPNRGNHEDKSNFVDQAAAPETTRLHCYIPYELHLKLKIMAVHDRAHVSNLVVEALQNYVDQRS